MAACLALEDSLTYEQPIVVLADSKGLMTVALNWVGEGKDLLLRHSPDGGRHDQFDSADNDYASRRPTVKVESQQVTSEQTLSTRHLLASVTSLHPHPSILIGV